MPSKKKSSLDSVARARDARVLLCGKAEVKLVTPLAAAVVLQIFTQVGRYADVVVVSNMHLVFR